MPTSYPGRISSQEMAQTGLSTQDPELYQEPSKSGYLGEGCKNLSVRILKQVDGPRHHIMVSTLLSGILKDLGMCASVSPPALCIG